MDPRLVEMGSLGGAPGRPRAAGVDGEWPPGGRGVGGPWVLRAGGSGPTARLRKGTLAKGTLSRLGRAGVFEGNIIKGTNLTRPRTEHFRA